MQGINRIKWVPTPHNNRKYASSKKLNQHGWPVVRREPTIMIHKYLWTILNILRRWASTPYQRTTNSKTRKVPTARTTTRSHTIYTSSLRSNCRLLNVKPGRLRTRIARATNIWRRSVANVSKRTMIMTMKKCAILASFDVMWITILLSRSNNKITLGKKVRAPKAKKRRTKKKAVEWTNRSQNNLALYPLLPR